MKINIPEKSLFSILLRSEWWKSALIAAAFVFVGQTLVPDQFKALITTVSMPFAIIAMVALWRQRDKPGSGRIERTAEAVLDMSWKEFSDLLEQAFQREGFDVVRTSGAADFELNKGGRTVLVSGKRWKAASHGLEPLKELVAEREKKEAREVRYICIKEVTENAARYAKDNRIVLMQGAELAQLLRLPKGKKSS